ncbi:MAG: hypothetical protein RLZZ84_2038 [Pseudomonadota bacterium]|jgi:F-type H+-transporting ATPase subunit b
MPQISQLAATYASQIFWLLVFFGFIFFVIGKGMVPKVMATVEARDNQIAGDLAAAEAARKGADAEEEAWRVQSAAQRARAQDVIAKAKLDAAKASEKSFAKANAKIDDRVAKAELKIAEARTAGLAEIQTVASEAAADIAQRIAGLTVDAKAAKAAVKEALNG